MNRMSQYMISLLLLLLTTQFVSGQNDEWRVKGVYKGKNLFVQNPDNSVKIPCVYKVRVNDLLITDPVFSSAFQIDFKGLNLEVGDSLEIKFYLSSDCEPRILNPEVIEMSTVRQKTSFGFSDDYPEYFEFSDTTHINRLEGKSPVGRWIVDPYLKRLLILFDREKFPKSMFEATINQRMDAARIDTIGFERKRASHLNWNNYDPSKHFIFPLVDEEKEEILEYFFPLVQEPDQHKIDSLYGLIQQHNDSLRSGFIPFADYAEGEFVDGQREGLWKKYHYNGNLAAELIYEGGKAHGLFRTFNLKGQPKEIGTIKDDTYEHLIGEFMRFFDNGGIEVRTSFNSKGKPVGLIKYYYPNQIIELVTSIKDNKIHGYTVRFDSSGNLVDSTYYRNGKKALPDERAASELGVILDIVDTENEHARRIYELAEQERELLESQRREEEKEHQLQQEKSQRYLLFGGLSVLGVVVVFVFRSYQRKKKDNRLITEQKQLVEEKNKEIVDSISYARRLQEAILPPKKIVRQYLPDSFILYRPKDIVAGDFYWLEQGQESEDETIYFAAADCTGHGVPGAMVSVVCSNALSKALMEEGITQPSRILDRARELVISRFERSASDVKDGMDISLCALNLKTLELNWAGANNPLWIIRKDSQSVEEIRADKQPIGRYAVDRPFTNHQIQLNKGDSIYIFSDGYYDQFGGEKGKKYKSGRFKKFLLTIVNLPHEKQRAALSEEFDKWRGELEQIDDVCVIGLRL